MRLKNTKKDSLSLLAGYIVRNHPKTTVVTGSSWIMSRSIAGKLGFTVTETLNTEVVAKFGTDKYSEKDNPFTQPGYWGQIFDKHGNMRDGILDYLKEHKRLPYDFA